MSEQWKRDIVEEEMHKICERLTEVWAIVEEGYGPEVVYSIIMNVCFQFAAGYEQATKGAVTADQVLDNLTKALKERRPTYITESSKSSEEDRTSE